MALSIIGAVYKNGYVKNKVMEFVGPGVKNLPIEYRNGIDVMTTETTCWSSIWVTDEATKDYLTIHGRPEAYKELKPADVAYYDGCVYVDLAKVECTIALPMHPSYTMPISELKANAKDILHDCQEAANRQITGASLDLVSKVHDGGIWVDQGLVAGCSGGTFDNLCAVADILRGNSCGNGTFKMSVYPGSMPAYLQLMKNGALTDIASAGAIIRECFCGPCFGAGDTPANGEFSIRHTTRNFPNREGSKPGEGQMAGVALMDARSIAATAINGGKLTAAAELDREAGKAQPEEVKAVYAALEKVVPVDPANTVIGSTIYANKPGDGSAREQAASCQRVLGAAANLALEYATKRYRSNCINWGMAPLPVKDGGAFALGDYVFVPGIRKAILEGVKEFDAYVVKPDGAVNKVSVSTGGLTPDERQIIADGCLINYYRNH